MPLNAQSPVGAGLPAMAVLGSPASLASQLPPFKHEAKSPWAERSQRTVTKSEMIHALGAQSPVGAGLPAMAAPRLCRETASPASLVSKLPPFKHEAKSPWAEQVQRTDSENDPCHSMPNLLWEPACRRWLYCACAGKQRRLHRWQASSHHSNMGQKAPGPSGRSSLIPKMIHAT